MPLSCISRWSPPAEKKKGFLLELPDETMLLQCTSKADMEDWVRDTNRLRGGRVDLASGQNIGGYPPGHDIYEGGRDTEVRECYILLSWQQMFQMMKHSESFCGRRTPSHSLVPATSRSTGDHALSPLLWGVVSGVGVVLCAGI